MTESSHRLAINSIYIWLNNLPTLHVLDKGLARSLVNIPPPLTVHTASWPLS
jgi:hypothetical protein